MEIKIAGNSQSPIYKQIVNQIREAIFRGELREGLILPSERKLAIKISVHRNTVTKAYQELKAEGYIESFQGIGYKVIFSTPDANASAKERYRSIPWEHLMKKELLDYENSFDELVSKSYSKSGISFAGGIVPAEAYYKEDIKDILKELIESRLDEIYEYSHYQGLFRLRQNICTLLRGKGINASPNEIQVVTETNQAIDYLSELFINPGDPVITEEPVSPDIYRSLKLSRAKVVTVPMDEEGISLPTLESVIATNRPKFIYVSSSYNDPTGIIMSLTRRKELLELANRYRVPIIEEDSASEIRYSEDSIPTIKSLDKNGSVIYIYSFALTFAPGLKLAFVVAPRQVTRKISYLLSMHIVNIDSLMQSIMSLYIEKGLYEKNVRYICKIYEGKRDLMCRMLDVGHAYGISYNKPSGGVYIWCRLPDNLNYKKFLHAIRRKGVSLIPGHMFFPYGSKGGNYIRLNYSYPSVQEIEDGVGLLIDTLIEGVE